MKKKQLYMIIAGVCLLCLGGTAYGIGNLNKTIPSGQEQIKDNDKKSNAEDSAQEADAEDPTQEADAEDPTQEADAEDPAQEADAADPTQEADAEAPTQQPNTPAPTQRPNTPAPTQRPTTPAPTQRPNTPAPTQRPNTPAPTQRPNTPAPTQQPTPAPHVHNWVQITVFHPQVTHQETVVDQEAWTETIPVYEEVAVSICNGCGMDITNNLDHIEEQVLAGNLACGGWHTEYREIQTGTKTIEHPQVTHQETVVDEEAWTEVTGERCTGCGATR